MSELVLILVVAALGMYWLAAMRCKELAVAAARRECKLADVQLLDQTVQQNHISMSRDSSDRWRVWRRYRFEYSQDGVERHAGSLVMLGQKVTHVALDTINTIIH